MDILIIGRILHPEVEHRFTANIRYMGKDTGPGHAHGEAERCAWGKISPFPHGPHLPAPVSLIRGIRRAANQVRNSGFACQDLHATERVRHILIWYATRSGSKLAHTTHIVCCGPEAGAGRPTFVSLAQETLKLYLTINYKNESYEINGLDNPSFFFIHTQDSKHSIFLKLFVIKSFRFCNNVFLKIESWMWTRLYSVDTVVFC